MAGPGRAEPGRAISEIKTTNRLDGPAAGPGRAEPGRSGWAPSLLDGALTILIKCPDGPPVHARQFCAPILRANSVRQLCAPILRATFARYLGPTLDLPWTWLAGLAGTYLGPTLDLPWTYLGPTLDIPWIYLGPFLSQKHD